MPAEGLTREEVFRVSAENIHLGGCPALPRPLYGDKGCWP